MKSYQILFVVLFIVAACGTDPALPGEDAGTAAQDVGGQPSDMGSIPEDTGTSNPQDQGTTEPDMGEVALDSGGEPDSGIDMAMDAGSDAGSQADMSGTDAGTDAGTTCDQTGFTQTSSSVGTIGTELFLYEAIEGLETDPNFRVFELGIYPMDGGSISTQSFQFFGESYADCGVCLLAYACTQAGCNTTLMAQSGNVDITAIGTGDGDAFSAEFSDIVFQEVDIDSNTFATTLVPGGLEWCVPSFLATGTNVAN